MRNLCRHFIGGLRFHAILGLIVGDKLVSQSDLPEKREDRNKDLAHSFNRAAHDE